MSDTATLVPAFDLPVAGGESDTISNSALSGTAYVLFFYPRDDTSGCTKENEAFTALQPEFDALGVKLFGVSKDSIASHDKFMAKKSLTVPLISDESGTLSEDLGVWKEKSMYGKKFMGIERSTFLVGADGHVVQEWRKVKVPGHAEAVLEAAKAL